VFALREPLDPITFILATDLDDGWLQIPRDEWGGKRHFVMMMIG